MKLDELVVGTIDLHCHVYPEMTLEHEARQDDVELIEGALRARMGGVLLKSHFWPTVARVYYLKKRFPEIQIFSSITLNRVSGGVDPLVVESAALQGASAVIFPTWQAANDLERGGFSRLVRERLPRAANDRRPGLTIVGNGRLTTEASEVLDVAKSFNMLVCTGHLSPKEGLTLIDGARQRGLQVLFSHPSSHVVGASLDEMRQAAEMGAYVEFTALYGLSVRFHLPPRESVKVIQSIGAEYCILTTDHFNAWVPPMPEMMRLGMGQLAECGVPIADLRRMTVDNPRRLLRLDKKV